MTHGLEVPVGPQVRWHAAGAQTSLHALPAFRDWRMPDGTLWARFRRHAGLHWVEFPEFADFSVSPDGAEIDVYPFAPSVGQADLTHLLWNQILPLAQSLQGELVVHASAVSWSNGAVAFAAPSGTGKSTLAAYLGLQGARVHCDDGLHVLWPEQSPAPQQAQVGLGHRSIRLWEDSRQQMANGSSVWASPLGYTSKARLLSQDGLHFADGPEPLRGLCVLTPAATDEIRLQRISPADAVKEVVAHSFVMDPFDSGLLGRHFDLAVKFVTLCLVWRLEVPRNYDLLADVERVVRRDVLGERYAND